MTEKKDGKYYVMSPSEITDDLRNQAADDYAKFMTADSYKTYTKAYNVFIKKNPGYEEKSNFNLPLLVCEYIILLLYPTVGFNRRYKITNRT